MAQILIRKRKHFAEDVKPAEWTDLKWMARPRQGDVVEVRPNGYFRIEALGTGTHGWDREAFALIQVTNVDPLTVAYLGRSYSNAVPQVIGGTAGQPATVLYKRRYRFALWDQVPWVKTVVTVNGVAAEEWYYIRTNLQTLVVTDKVTA